MNLGMNEIGYLIAGVVALVLLRNHWPSVKSWFSVRSAATAGSGGETWWMPLLTDTVNALHQGYDLTITLKPREEKGEPNAAPH